MRGYGLKLSCKCTSWLQTEAGRTLEIISSQFCRTAANIVEKYYQKLAMDFDNNKRIVDECADFPSKRMRNKIAGYVTHLMKRIQRGPVRGISLKLQEEERERRLDFIPAVSALQKDQIEVDADTNDMLKAMDVKIEGLKIVGNKKFRSHKKPQQH
ncbi:hypothetical protein WA171_002612 [Blastocystis sp. BT1]